MSCKSHGAGGFAGTCRMLDPGQRCGLIHEFCGSMTFNPSTTKRYSCTPDGTFGTVTDQMPWVFFVIAVSGPNCPVTFTEVAFVARSRNLTPPSGRSSGEKIGGGRSPRRAGALVAGLDSCAEWTDTDAIKAATICRRMAKPGIARRTAGTRWRASESQRASFASPSFLNGLRAQPRREINPSLAGVRGEIAISETAAVGRSNGETVAIWVNGGVLLGRIGIVHRQNRSEERRVGKECRSRWVPCHEKGSSVSVLFQLLMFRGFTNRIDLSFDSTLVHDRALDGIQGVDAEGSVTGGPVPDLGALLARLVV